jgi:predicted nucleic acid-binding protein
MNGVLVDSNVILDIVTEDKDWFDWSAKTFQKYSEHYDLLINPIIFSEVSIGFNKIEEYEEILPNEIKRVFIPWEAAFLAGKAYLKYKKSGGHRHSPLPDFFIGAHAVVSNLILLSRDTKKLKHYFPNLHLVAPEIS